MSPKKKASSAAAKAVRPRIEERKERPAPTPPKTAPAPAANTATDRDPRLPPVGTTLTREHDNAKHQVKVLSDGFEYCGERYRSLSAIARKVTGTTWNGWLWFGLTKRGPSK